MKLSPKQIEWINNERRHYIELIAAKESGGVSRGIGWDKSQLQMLQVIIALHNLEIQPNTTQYRFTQSGDRKER